ncbi:MAG TPA: efflux RND transporter periplasmic adaptor subunit [Azospirillum sp.]
MSPDVNIADKDRTEDTHRLDPPRRKVRGRSMAVGLIIMLVVLGALGAALYGFNAFREKAIADFFAGNKPPPTPVAAAEAKVQSVPKYLGAIGTLAASRQVTVAPEVGGRVMEISFQSGAAVKAGDPIVQINDATEQAELLGLRAQARLAEINLERARNLLRNQAGPQAQVDQMLAQLDEINASIKRMQATIAQKAIRAPFDGELGIRQVNVGQILETGSPVVTLTDLSTLFVNFTLPEQSLNSLHVGQAVLVGSDAVPGRSFDAKITTIEPQVSAETRAIKVQATLANQERKLLPGMFADVRVVLPPRPNMVVVPETAIDYTVYGDSVLAVRPSKDAEGNEGLVVERVPVKTGDRFENGVEILDGLKPGDRVVVSGQLKLDNGAAVTISDVGAPAPPQTLPRN